MNLRIPTTLSRRSIATRPLAFTRTDLLFSLGSAGILFTVAAAGVSATGSANGSTGCLNNLRALTRAWQQFEADHGFLPPNPDDGNSTPGRNWVPGIAGRGGAQEFNSDILMETNRSLLAPYLAAASVFRCPDDPRTGRYQGNDPAKAGTIVPAARSYSMNLAVGADVTVSRLGVPPNGSWLDNNHTHVRFAQYRTYGTFDDIVDPSPSNLAVLLDEDAASLNDGQLAFGMSREEWIDYPGARHNQGATVSFADGHAELYHWVDSRTFITNVFVTRRLVPGSPDYARLRPHISAPFPASTPLIAQRSTPARSPDVKVVWPVTGTNYLAEFSDDLSIWTPLPPLTFNRGEAGVVDPSPSASGRRFYRLHSR